MNNAHVLHKPTLWVNVRSLLQWLAGGTLLITGTILIVIMSFFMSPYRLDWIARPFLKGVAWVTLARVRAFGREKLDPRRPYIFVMNHINMFDHFFLYSVLHRTLRGVEKEDHFKWPVYGILIRRFGMIPIPPRGDTQRAIQSLARLKEIFGLGVSICMMPEGTRSATGELQPFKKGAFYLAVQCQATIVPVTMVGAYALNRKGDWRIYPGPVDLYFDDPIPTQGLTEKDVAGLRDRVRSIIAGRSAEREKA